MIAGTKVICECVSSKKLEIIIPSSMPQKEKNKLLVPIEINKDEVWEDFSYEKNCIVIKFRGFHNVYLKFFSRIFCHPIAVFLIPIHELLGENQGNLELIGLL